MLSLGALFALLLSLWVRLRISYSTDNGLRVWARILFFKYHILPAKEKKIKLHDFKIKRFRKLERKRAQKAEKERAKDVKKRTEEEAIPTEITEELPLTEKISRLIRLITKILRLLSRYLRVDVSKLYIKVASDDAAKTAYLYSAAVQSAAYLTELMRGVTNFDVERGADFTVVPDFVSEQPEFSADFTFRLRVFYLLKLGLTALFGYLRIQRAKDNA